MSADRLRVIVDEIAVTIKQTFDDKVVPQSQIAYWTIIVANQLLGQHNIKRDSGAFLSIFTDVPVKASGKTVNPNLIKGRKYIELPGNIFDFDKDGGVEYIAYYNPNENCEPEAYKKTIQRTSPGELQWLKLDANTNPSPETPYWYRAGDYVYLVGIEAVPVKLAEIGIYMTVDPLEKIDLDKPFPFPQELLHVLKRQVTDLARFSFLFPADKTNDGNDSASETPNKQPIQKIVSVNDQQQQAQ
jgi:hypothetical protein